MKGFNHPLMSKRITPPPPPSHSLHRPPSLSYTFTHAPGHRDEMRCNHFEREKEGEGGGWREKDDMLSIFLTEMEIGWNGFYNIDMKWKKK